MRIFGLALISALLIGCATAPTVREARQPEEPRYELKAVPLDHPIFLSPSGPPLPPLEPQWRMLEVDDDTIEYVIKPGDTLWRIARAHGVALNVLLSANQLSESDANMIAAGQRIIIPAGR